ncbi:hypothetical protein SAMN05216436_102204 [bacterium A37T11]|nr:hypothetical protein SAMN05216436_102204 [bacterium A37T11]
MVIERTLIVQKCHICIRMEPGVLRIINDFELWKLLGTHPRLHTSILVDTALLVYLQFFQHPLAISHASLIVEIWGHVYYEWLILSLKHAIPISFLHKKLNEMVRPSQIIDCGEKGKDSNRWFWNFLAPLKWLIGFFLPRHIDCSSASNYKKEQ